MSQPSSFTVPSSEPRRPTVVTAAGYLLFTAALLLVVSPILHLPYLGRAQDVARVVYAKLPSGGDVVATTLAFSLIASLVLTVLVTAGLVVLGVFDLKGSRVARIITWVVAGLAVVCCGGGTFAGRFTGGLASPGSANTNGVDMVAAAREVQAVYPTWVNTVGNIATVLALVALLAVIVLLALPAANAYVNRGAAGQRLPRLPDLPTPRA